MPTSLPIPLPQPLRDITRKTINRAPSPVLAVGLPWLVVMIGSLSPTWPIIASAPVLPPLGFILLVAWRQIHPAAFPVWAGLPLGLFDDLFSGQPFGSAVLLWSLAMIGLEAVEARFPWRGFLQEWVAAAGLIALYLLLALLLAGAASRPVPLMVLAPQLIISILTYPLIGRIVALADRLRLLPIREVE